MKILVTGGTGVIGAGVIPQLLSRGHGVRILSRNADEDARQWNGVEAIEGDIGNGPSLRGACGGCDVILHVAGIVTEQPPDATFQKINVEGTRNVVVEAQRSGASRIVFISSLGADKGSSDYHRSKREAEQIVSESGLDWTIIRPGLVYGPGDEVISNILKMVRALPAVPIVDHGLHPFQPIWFEDLGKAIVAVLERGDLGGQTLEIAGDDVTSLTDLLNQFGEITGRSPLRVPVPMPIATLGAKVASAAADIPFDETKLTMLREKNVLPETAGKVLESLGVTPTPLSEGLRLLADSLPEKSPEDGVGAMHHKRFWADISGSPHSAASLMTIFRDRVTEIMPMDFASEPGVPVRIERGATMTGALPLRGHFQVRVEVAEPTHVVLATVEGHPLAGIVEFTTKGTQSGLTFAIDVHSRAANFLDLVAIRTVGETAQSANWRTVVERMIEISGGTSGGVETQSRKLEEPEAEAVEKRIRGMVQQRQRSELTPAERPAQR